MTKPRERAPRIGKLNTALEIAAEIGRVYRDCRHGRLDSGTGHRLAGILSAMRSAVETAVFESRISELKAAVSKKAMSRFSPMTDPTRSDSFSESSEPEIPTSSNDGSTRRH